ncbi:MAG TPA: FliG C-terminal domain-containing protein [Bdellovibrionota bacterium]|nr:FliG C-terminal domain-containing protein [Bdellovibrionota bacterium]
MKTVIRTAGTLLAGLLFLGASQARAEFREEVATLESIYERNARSVLNEIMTPDQYNVVVSAAIREDEDVLAQYRKEAESGFLPGLIVADDLAPTFSEANNKLHQLKTRVTIYVLLDGSVSGDKEKVIRDMLASKLHLNLADGDPATTDSVQVTRSSLPSSRSPASVARLLPELTWKMWVLLIILGGLVLVGIYLWATRRKELEPEGMSMPNRPGDADGADAVDEPTAREKIRWCKEQILSLCTQYPQAVSRAIASYYDKGGEQDVVVLFDQLGWGVARKAFGELSPAVWSRMAAMVKEGKEKVELGAALKTVETMYHFILSSVLSRGFNKDDNNPFQFLFRLPDSDRRVLLKGESAQNLAVVGMFSSPEQLAELMGPLDAGTQQQVLQAVARMQTLPDSQVQAAAKSLAGKLEAFKKAPSLETNGASVAADFLRALSPEREMDLFEQMLQSSPGEADRIRRARVQFMDLALFPDEIVNGGLDEVDTGTLTKALYGSDSGLVDRLISMMPPKKAMMIQSDLQSGNMVSRSEVATARRAVNEAIEKYLASQKMSVEDLWKRLEGSGNTQEFQRAA